MIQEVSIFIFSLLLSYFSIKNVIYIATVRHLFDEPTEDRKIHITKKPNLGGIGFLGSFIFSVTLFIPMSEIPYLNYFLAAGITLFFVGMKDDLVGMNSISKLIAQIIAATIIVVLANIRIHSLNGMFGIEEISYPFSIILSIIFSVFIYNAINLIDGVNGLAAGIGLFCCTAFGYLFYMENSTVDVIITCALAGSLISFLYFNVILNKIFMGDTGSLGLGFVLSILTMRYLDLSWQNHHDSFGIPLVFGILILPVFDTLRVFTNRILKGKSPFAADDNHIHHSLLALGLSHNKVTGSLISFNIAIFFLNMSLKGMSDLYIIILDLAIIIGVNSFVVYKCNKRREHTKLLDIHVDFHVSDFENNDEKKTA